MTKGLTLIELVVVIAIILVGVAVILPGYNSYMARNNLRQAANLLATDIRRAEEEARRVGVSGIVNGVAGHPNQLILVNASGQIVFSDAFPAGVAGNSAPALAVLAGCAGAVALQLPDGTGIVFNPQGNPVTCTGIPWTRTTETQTLTDPPRDDQFVVTVDTRTGVVSGP